MGLDLSDPLGSDKYTIELDEHGNSLSELTNNYEKKVLEKALERYNYHKTNVANALGINRKTLFNKMKRYNLE